MLLDETGDGAPSDAEQVSHLGVYSGKFQASLALTERLELAFRRVIGRYTDRREASALPLSSRHGASWRSLKDSGSYPNSDTIYALVITDTQFVRFLERLRRAHTISKPATL
jgi:hypothetical protein